MSNFKHRDIYKQNFMGEEVRFIESNERVKERVRNISHEREMIETMLTVSEPDDIIWDVGACLGIHSFICGLHVPYGKVMCFEPMPVNRGVLVDNMHINQIDNIEVYKHAVAEESGKTRFSIRESMEAGYGRHGISTGDYDEVHKIQVRKTCGDDFSHLKQIPNVVKIDVEGASPLVLRGMEKTLKKDECRELFLETHEPNPVQPSHEDFGFTREDIIDFIKSCGFKVETLEEDFHIHATKDDFPQREFETSEYNINGIKVKIEQGDISNRSEEVIVNSAGTSLRMGTGVAGSLREKGGEKLNVEAVRKGPIEVGQVVVTDSYNLDCNKVIHAASMPHHGSGSSTPKSIRKATRNALREADKMGVKEMAIPSIGCGIAGVPLTQGAPVIIEEINNFENDSIEKIVLVGYTEEEFRTIHRAIDSKSTK